MVNKFLTALNNNTVFEPVDVIVYYSGLHPNIVKFKWRGSVYKVTEMLQSWKIPVREGFEHHYVVTCRDSDLLCELSFSNSDFKWQIVRYDNLS